MKSELKHKRYDCSKVQGPSCRDWKLPGILLRKGRGIYIIMYINSGIYLQDFQGGFICEGESFQGVLWKIAKTQI
jgi:hypothetical protein